MPKTPLYLFEFAGRKFSATDLAQSLSAVDIRSSDILFVHSNLTSFGKLSLVVSRQQYLDAFIQRLVKLVGKRGTVILPTFSYSFCRGEIYDPVHTPSAVGLLSERFRTTAGVVRTLDPIFSVAIWGANQKYFQDVGTDCFGKNSIFEKLYEKNAKIVFLGETFDLTYLHFIEQRLGVPYRQIKKFKGQIRIGNGFKESEFDYNVRPLDGSVVYDLDKIAEFLDRRGVLKKTRLGYSQIRVVEAKDAYDTIADKLSQNPRFLLKK